MPVIIVIIPIILRTFFVSSGPRVPIEEAVSRKTLGMREVAPTTGTERENSSLLYYLLANMLALSSHLSCLWLCL